jgi:hypothetical protein
MYTVKADNELLYAPGAEHLKLFSLVLTQDVNAADSLVFSFYPGHPFYNRLEEMGTMVNVYLDTEWLFRGRVLKEVMAWDMLKTITCEGEFAFLGDSIVRPYSWPDNVHPELNSVKDFLAWLMLEHNDQVGGVDPQPYNWKGFNLGEVTIPEANQKIIRANINYPTTLKEIQDKLLNMLGGFITFSSDPLGISPYRFINYVATGNRGCKQVIRLGENLLDLKKETKGEELATGIIPLGAKQTDGLRLTIASVNSDKDFLLNNIAAEKYGRIFQQFVYDDITLPANLKTRGQRELNSMTSKLLTIELSAIDLNLVDKAIDDIRFMDIVQVESAPHGIDRQMMVKKKITDMLNPENTKLTLKEEEDTTSSAD